MDNITHTLIGLIAGESAAAVARSDFPGDRLLDRAAR
jgi:hypothetical protein